MMEDLTRQQHPASFRDPSGFVFIHDGVVYRAVRLAGQQDYDHLMSSGLYRRLSDEKRMIGHEEADHMPLPPDTYKILRPQQLHVRTYPYEWCFRQLKDAALLTLHLAATALEYGMILKDAPANNIQFIGNRPVLIDSLSFARYEEGQAWQAFQQFCAHFLYPLLLFQKIPELTPAIRMAYPEGVSARVTAALLPWKSWFNWKAQLYVYLAAAVTGEKASTRSARLKISKQKLLQNITQLRELISALQPPGHRTAWSEYYDRRLLSEAYLENKKDLIVAILKDVEPRRVIDAGCNTGIFSLLAAAHSPEVIAYDNDPVSIDVLYRDAVQRKCSNISILIGDIVNPAPALGWANGEQPALIDRLSGDMVLALALVHHLAIAKNIPLPFISALFARITSRWLVIEFVPKSDPKVQILLQSRADIFPGYTKEDFEKVFSQEFHIRQSHALSDSDRILYLMERS
jgi:SAM-dependent methyltransferase